jgi:hypothetical protein
MLLSPARRAQCPRGSTLPDKLLFTLYISFNYLFYIILMDSYSSLFAALEQRPHSDTVCNPYRLPGRTHNLRAYFRRSTRAPDVACWWWAKRWVTAAAWARASR